LNANNVVWSGCVNIEGEGKGVILKTGDQVLIGKLADKIVSLEDKVTGMER